MNKQRLLFINQLFAEMRALDYIWLENESLSTDKINATADINFFLEKKDYSILYQFFAGQSNSTCIETINTCHGKSTTLIFEDGSYVRINILFSLHENGWLILTRKEIKEKSRINKQGIRVLCDEHFFELHFLKSLIQKIDIPQVVVLYFIKLDFARRSKVFGYISFKYRLIKNKLDELFEFENQNLNSVKKIAKGHTHNYFVIRFIRKTNCQIRRINHSFRCQKLVIAFSGRNSVSYDEISRVLSNNYKRKTVALSTNTFFLFSKKRSYINESLFSLALLKLYISLRYLLFNYIILITGNRQDKSLSENLKDSNTIIKVFVQDILEVQLSDVNQSDGNTRDLFQRLGIDPSDFSMIILEYIDIDHKAELLMKTSIRAN